MPNIEDYFFNSNEEKLNKIKKRISRKSKFCSFKRTLIKKDSNLKAIFEKYFD